MGRGNKNSLKKRKSKEKLYCSTCKNTRDSIPGLFCSNPFHFCKKCNWSNGKIVKACKNCKGKIRAVKQTNFKV